MLRVAATVALGIIVGLAARVRTDDKVSALIVLDGAGKEIKLTSWKFVLGTKHLGWLGEPSKAPEKKGKKVPPPVPQGPEFLEFREDKTPAYEKDITTYIPVTSVRKIEYDHDKKVVAVTFLAAGDKEQTLIGPAKYANINKFNIDGAVEPGTASLAGDVKFQDGFLKVGIKGYRFPGPAQAAPAPSGRPAVIVALDKTKTVHKITGVVPIYRTGLDTRAVPVLLFQKTVKIDFAKITKLTHMASKDKKNPTLDFEVTQDDGTKQGLTLLEKTAFDDKQGAILVGLAGKVSAGYRLFPAHVIAELRFEEK